MRLQYFGHSCFRIISDIGTTIVLDPFDGNMVGFDMPRTRTDVVTESHHHADHDCTDNIVGSYALLDGKVTCAADDIAIDTVETWHDNENGAKRGANLVFRFLVDGIKVVHMGDVGFVDANVVRATKGCDVLLLPVGGVYTIDAEGAVEYIRQIAPKLVIPMHYMTDLHKFTLEPLTNFLTLCAANGWSTKQLGSDTLRMDDVPQNDITQIVVLDRYVED